MRALIDDNLIAQHRARAMTPDRPVLRGTAQNPDAFFQAREAVQSFLRCVPRHHAKGDGRVRRSRSAAATSCSITSARPTPSASLC